MATRGDWRKEWKVKGAYPTAQARNKEFTKLKRKYGDDVKKVNRKRYIVFGANLPYLIKMRRGAEYK